MSGLYRWLASTPVGGFHEWWPLFVVIHDDGVCAGWRRVQRLRIGK